VQFGHDFRRYLHGSVLLAGGLYTLASDFMMSKSVVATIYSKREQKK
jgi:hypothetical protein